MKKIFSILILSFFVFSIDFTYARTLSKQEYRYLKGAYLLGRGNKKRLIKLLNKTEVINAKLLELEKKQKNLEESIKSLKQQINEISNKLDQIIKLLKTVSSLNVKSEPQLKHSSQSQLNTNKNTLNKVKRKDTEEYTLKESKLKSSKTQKQKEEKTKEDIAFTKSSLEKNRNENIKKVTEKKYTISDLINDIENAIYYKGKGDLKSFEKLINEMKKKYPEYRSKLENCLKDPDYIFQLYIEVLNLETK
ncbi:MAG TPA: hypothetical protein EYH39_00755 [Desulfurobacteriaceae bacterium]|nr:hypothetical protein [Desulfurobacteriaceae bacterium]